MVAALTSDLRSALQRLGHDPDRVSDLLAAACEPIEEAGAVVTIRPALTEFNWWLEYDF
jgi:hypothetical protein